VPAKGIAATSPSADVASPARVLDLHELAAIPSGSLESPEYSDSGLHPEGPRTASRTSPSSSLATSKRMDAREPSLEPKDGKDEARKTNEAEYEQGSSSLLLPSRRRFVAGNVDVRGLVSVVRKPDPMSLGSLPVARRAAPTRIHDPEPDSLGQRSASRSSSQSLSRHSSTKNSPQSVFANAVERARRRAEQMTMTLTSFASTSAPNLRRGSSQYPKATNGVPTGASTEASHLQTQHLARSYGSVGQPSTTHDRDGGGETVSLNKTKVPTERYLRDYDTDGP